ncbi:MAG: arginase family protein [Myxococcota bacterium]
MTERIPNTQPAEWPTPRADRFAACIQAHGSEGCQLALLGLPDDTGVRLNGGRPGAAHGPKGLRAALATYGTPWDIEQARELDVRVFDAGDVVPAAGQGSESLLATHARVEQAVLELHARGLLPICIGGGHDLSFPTISALGKHLGRGVGGINFDAHLDVRQRVGSGMPFRRLIEAGFLEPARFVEFGLGRFVNDRSDIEWLRAQGATLISAERVRREGLGFTALHPICFGAGPGFLSVDLDGLDSAQMAAVSALNPEGLPVATLSALVEAAGADPRVQQFDMMELAPELDASGRGVRVAAHVLLCFIAGFTRRAQ